MSKTIYDTKKGPKYTVYVYYEDAEICYFMRGKVIQHSSQRGRNGGRWMTAIVEENETPVNLYPENQIDPLDKDKFYTPEEGESDDSE